MKPVDGDPGELRLAHSTLDLRRADRTGHAEVVYGEGKSAAELAEILAVLNTSAPLVLATRVSPEKAALVAAKLPTSYDALARVLWLGTRPPPGPRVAVVSAGTSDGSVAAEAAIVAELLGLEVLRVADVGVAGVHRVLRRADELRACAAVIVVAGMDGALPSVVGGLVRVPVIAVPTSVGYGAAFGGVAALLAMLNSCAPGVVVVNIDNGFGAAFAAARMALCP